MAMAETIEQLKIELNEKDNIISDLTNSYNSLNLEFENVKLSLNDKQSEINNLNEHISMLENQLNQGNVAFEGLSNEYQKVIQQLNLYRAALIQLCKDFN